MKRPVLLSLLAMALAAPLAAAPLSGASPVPGAAAERAPASAQPPVAERTLSFRQLGASSPLSLRGGNGVAGVNFGSRADEVITQARLKLRYTYSPSMLAELSHVKVLLNDEVVAVLPLPKERGGVQQEAELPLDARLLADFNRLQFQLVGHYTQQCEDPAHSSLWAQISNASELTLVAQSLPLVDDLSRFPEPFFDRRDFGRLTLPFVFGERPSFGTLRAAGVLSSWFGAAAQWRGARFPAYLGGLPDRQHAVVFATNGERPAFLASYPPVGAPTVAVVSHPAQPERKLLLVLGRDDKDLKQAADALVLGQAAMTGQKVTIGRVSLDAPRQPYDAPNWVRLDRPTKFGELVTAPQELEVAGQLPDPIRVNLRVPADLFTWRSRGIPIGLKFRYTAPAKSDGSQLSVGVNGNFVQSFGLRPAGQGGEQSSLRLPLLGDGLFGAANEVLLPAFRVGSRNQLQFQYAFELQKEGNCNGTVNDNFRAAIDPDSEIDFSGYPHFATMPNLGFFANSGYPFTRYADLSDSVLVLPATPSAQDVETLLTLLGRMGESTGYPALRYRLIAPAQIGSAKDADLLVIGAAAQQPLLAGWRDRLPTVIDGAARRVADGDRFFRQTAGWHGPDTPADTAVRGQAEIRAQGRLAALLGFESPYSPGRSVVVVTGSEPAALGEALDALGDDARIARMYGSAVLIRAGQVDSQLVGPTYQVGKLPLWTWVWFYLSERPILLALMAILAVCTFAFAILRLLKAVAARRLED
ncbi:cellulose synthase subunit [Crenobacter luteus]|uniref:cellulose biosynthesis cyclic di-GMP-binding regulatory protein BcsB n=1 Tax=Crenobacter luteus TaxID=1452487 RepID=UPI00104342DE|nr:cellulose biosynthesis cyclic di-GMP-binding regulatory protein BcsB [Crenobacter luteus]TCP10627.1 cellulose synthase subunit [Crenobacter luteus]